MNAYQLKYFKLVQMEVLVWDCQSATSTVSEIASSHTIKS